MDDTDVFQRRSLPARRWLAGWRQAAQLGMLLDGRAHTWSCEAPRGGRGLCASLLKERAGAAPRLARLIA